MEEMLPTWRAVARPRVAFPRTSSRFYQVLSRKDFTLSTRLISTSWERENAVQRETTALPIRREAFPRPDLLGMAADPDSQLDGSRKSPD
jgi:hypothetical protein